MPSGSEESGYDAGPRAGLGAWLLLVALAGLFLFGLVASVGAACGLRRNEIRTRRISYLADRNGSQ